MLREFNCPNCGAALSCRLNSSRLVVCEYCDGTSFIEDEAVRLAGEKGVMHERPGLLHLGQPFSYRGREYIPVGQARFDYGQGWWDEFWAIDGGDGIWISVDEGNIAVERPIEVDQREIPPAYSMKAGRKLKLGGNDYLVTEFGEANCLAVRGELPEVLKPGDGYRYAHLRTGASTLVTLEYSTGPVAATQGEWLDPFEIAS